MPSPDPDSPRPAPRPEGPALPPRGARAFPVVLGIDPGTRVLGYGALVAAARPRLLAAGEIRSGARVAVPERLATIRRELDALLARLDPDVVVIEQAFAALNVQSALRMGEGRGVVLACAACAGAQIVQITPAEAKQTLVGNGAADKRQVARMVAILLDRDDLPERLDVTDALAIALAHVQRARAPRGRARGTSRFEELVARLAPDRPGARRKGSEPPRTPRPIP